MIRGGRRGRGGGGRGRGGLAGDEEQPAREQAWLANDGRGGQGTGSSSSGHGGSRRRRNNRWENGQTVMDSCNRIYHDVENEEIYLWVVSKFVGHVGVGPKSSPNFTEKVHRRNFDDRCRANGLVAHETDRTFRMRASSRTPACIYR